MIKVGQIYKEIGTSNKWVVTRVITRYNDVECNMICQDGEATGGFVPYFFWEKLELIAEYPTWQEAVNSKEFNNAD